MQKRQTVGSGPAWIGHTPNEITAISFFLPWQSQGRVPIPTLLLHSGVCSLTIFALPHLPQIGCFGALTVMVLPFRSVPTAPNSCLVSRRNQKSRNDRARESRPDN